jgi:hypothetical protein
MTLQLSMSFENKDQPVIVAEKWDFPLSMLIRRAIQKIIYMRHKIRFVV